MWLYRFLLAMVGGSCLVILSAALTRTAASVAPVTFAFTASEETAVVSPAPLPRPDAEASRYLEQALDALKADRVSWLETAIWQKFQLPKLSYEANGSYRLAPGQRFRLEMRTHLGESEGTLLMVSDGRDLWQGTRPGEGPWENVTRLRLTEVFSTMNGPAGPQLRDEFLQRPHFQGMTPLLCSLRSRLIWARSEVTHHASGDRIHLVGVWSKEETAKLAPPEEAWPTNLPRQCHLYLDAHNYWAQRVEWWGPTATNGADRLLVQMEFRNPVFNRPLTADECERLFAFQPGNASIDDETASVTAEMTKRAGELAPQNTTR
jgi:hypothetical protein